MSSARNIAIAGWSVAVLLTTSLVAIRPAGAAPGAGFELLVVGDPRTPVPEPFKTDSGYGFLFAAFNAGATSISDIGGLTSDGNSVVIKAACTNTADPDHNVDKPLVQVELGSQLAYQYQVDGVAANLCAASEIASFTLTITTSASSCLATSNVTGHLEVGSYPLTKTRLGTLGNKNYANNPLAPAYPAWVATKNGTPGTFTSGDVLGGALDKWGITAYLRAARPCAPVTGPAFSGSTPFTTNAGRLGVYDYDPDTFEIIGSLIEQVQANAFTTTISLASGGAGRYQSQQIMAPSPGAGITGAKRIQALPLGTGTSGASTYGGYRTDGLFVQCGANTNTTLITQETRCRMAGTTPTVIGGVGNFAPGLGVRVQNGGDVSTIDTFRHWSAAGTAEVGQTVKFRAREVSWAGYGLHSPETIGTMTDGN